MSSFVAYLQNRIDELCGNEEFSDPSFLDLLVDSAAKGTDWTSPTKPFNSALPEYLEEYRAIKDILANLTSKSSALNDVAKQVQGELEHFKEDVTWVADKALALEKARQECRLKLRIANALKGCHVISDESLAILHKYQQLSTSTATQSPSFPVEPDFFVVFDDINRVQSSARQLAELCRIGDCELDSNEQITPAVGTYAFVDESLAESIQLKKSAMKTLFLLTRSFARVSDDVIQLLEGSDDSPGYAGSPQQMFRKALTFLGRHQYYFSTVLLDIVRKRRTVLQRTFDDLFAAGRSSAPVILSVEDFPIRIRHVLTDPESKILQMLQWILTALRQEKRMFTHGALALVWNKNFSQNEASSTPLNQTSQSDDPPSDTQPFSEEETIAENFGMHQLDVLLDAVFLGVASSFQSLTKIAISRLDGCPNALCQAYQLLQDYAKLYQEFFCEVNEEYSSSPERILEAEDAPFQSLNKELVPLSATFLKSLKELINMAESDFKQTWEAAVVKQKSLSQSVVCSPSLTPSAQLTDILNDLGVILKILEGSPMATNQDDTLLTYVLETSVAPLLNVCWQSSHTLKEQEQIVYLLNCSEAIAVSLSGYKLPEHYARLALELVNERKQALVALESDRILNQLGLKEKLNALEKWEIRSHEVKEKMAFMSSPSLHPLAVASCLHGFYNAVFTYTLLDKAFLSHISNASIAETTAKSILLKITDAYERFYNDIASLNLASYTPEQIRGYLGVNKAESYTETYQ